MDNNQIIFLFKKYLSRVPSEHEIEFHKIKKYEDFEDEIKNCDEYKGIEAAYPKMAFLLSGHVRNANIINFLNKNENIDVFVSCWDDIGLRGTEKNFSSKNIKSVEEKLNNIKNLKKYEILDNKNFIEKNSESKINYYNFSSPEVFIKSQLYSINRSFKLFEKYQEDNKEKYEIIFKFRFDASITKFNITKKTLNNIINKKVIFVTNDGCHNHPDFSNGCMACNKMYEKNMLETHIFDHTNIICDFFAYGNFENMKKYCSLYHEYDNLNLKFEKVNFESIKNKNINHTKKNNVVHLSHYDSIYYAYCSYPERLLQFYLKDYMLVSSKDVMATFHL